MSNPTSSVLIPYAIGRDKMRATRMTNAGLFSAICPIPAVSFVSFIAPDFVSGSAFEGNAVINAGRREILNTYIAKRPRAMTVPKLTRNICEESLKERKPTISVKIAMTNAAEVNTAPERIAFILNSWSKSFKVVLPCGSSRSISCMTSRIRVTTWIP